MTKNQSTIKSVAIAVATMLAIVIIGAICLSIYSVVSFFSSSGDTFTDGIGYNKTFDADDIDSIVIDNSIGKLTLRQGESFEVVGENVLESFSCELKKGELTIRHQSKRNINFTNFSKTSITITIPKGADFDDINISTGIEECLISDIHTSEFTLEAGVGNVTISNLYSDDTHIEGGVGNIDIFDSELGNLELDCGVGEASISAGLYNCDINSGVGNVILDINGEYEDYDIDISAGVGTIKIDGKKYKDDTRLNKGAKYNLEIDGGVGDISISFNQKI